MVAFRSTLLLVSLATGASAYTAVPCARPLLKPRRAAAPLLQESETPAVDRVFAGAAYLLPMLDGFPYGAFVYANIPPIGAIAYNFVPFVNAFNALPFAGLIFFFGLSYFTRQEGLSRFVRFNIQQAILLDIILLIPSFFGGAAGNMFPVELQGACARPSPPVPAAHTHHSPAPTHERVCARVYTAA